MRLVVFAAGLFVLLGKMGQLKGMVDKSQLCPGQDRNKSQRSRVSSLFPVSAYSLSIWGYIRFFRRIVIEMIAWGVPGIGLLLWKWTWSVSVRIIVGRVRQFFAWQTGFSRPSRSVIRITRYTGPTSMEWKWQGWCHVQLLKNQQKSDIHYHDKLKVRNHYGLFFHRKKTYT